MWLRSMPFAWCFRLRGMGRRGGLLGRGLEFFLRCDIFSVFSLFAYPRLLGMDGGL
jgi:hypothetical protein